MVPFLCPKCEKIFQSEEVLDMHQVFEQAGPDVNLDLVWYKGRYCPICYGSVYDIWEIKKYYKLYNNLYNKLRRIEEDK